MRKIVLVIATTVLSSVFATGQDSKQQTLNRQSSANSKHESPFACDRFALEPEQRKRHFEELGPTLRGLKTGVKELANGYEFRFPTDSRTFELLAEWIAGERLCCPFFDIQMRVEREGGPLWLRLTGREGTKQFIQADAPDWIKQ